MRKIGTYFGLKQVRRLVMPATIGVVFAVAVAAAAACEGRSGEKTVVPRSSNKVPSLKNRFSKPNQRQLEKVNVDALPTWEKRAWVEKAAKAILGRSTRLDRKELDTLSKLSSDDALDALLGDMRLADSVFDFLIDFRASNETRYPTGALNVFGARSVPQVVAAGTVVEGGDFLKSLFSSYPANFVEGFLPLKRSDLPSEYKDLNDVEARNFILAKLALSYDPLIEKIEKNSDYDFSTYCKDFDYNTLFVYMDQAGVPNSIVEDFVNDPAISGLTYGFCFGTAKQPTLSEIRDARRKLKLLVDRLPEFYPEKYLPYSVLEFKPFPSDGILSPLPAMDLFAQDWGSLSNSSTNSNRKRAAYVLGRYFCDDLTPINVLMDPAAHAKDRHASEASCQACHYKLDPMAGFFKDIGFFGKNFASEKEIEFDDQAVSDRVEYQSQWKFPSGGAREWNIGYIRSTRDDSKNSYGTNLTDLYSLLKTAPEVKRCVVKRMFEFYVSPSQTVDPAYLEEVSRVFESAPTSGQGFKAALKQFAKSQSFVVKDPDGETCYDGPSSGRTASAPPCRVTFILEKNCAQCHGSGAPAGGLDLRSWSEDAEGYGRFNHFGKDGQPIPRQASFARLAESLGSVNEEKRMPLGGDMPTTERAALYQWVQERVLQGGGK